MDRSGCQLSWIILRRGFPDLRLEPFTSTSMDESLAATEAMLPSMDCHES